MGVQQRKRVGRALKSGESLMRSMVEVKAASTQPRKTTLADPAVGLLGSESGTGVNEIPEIRNSPAVCLFA